MAEGYCVKCKAKKEIVDGVEETMKNGRKAIKGKCPTCGMALVPEGTRFGMLRHILGNPTHVIIMLGLMLAVMAAAMMWMR